ncbi:transcription termination factor 2-like [Sitophilus oryzae]|uniref:Transcription termination factor 2 n=1 Tax=Sitophilus oryzae TaxID=7048 RepID=A0A6J2YK97_SITOR|nr:transcription termination factor 2-like [Sitophilus oryzae]
MDSSSDVIYSDDEDDSYNTPKNKNKDSSEGDLVIDESGEATNRLSFSYVEKSRANRESNIFPIKKSARPILTDSDTDCEGSTQNISNNSTNKLEVPERSVNKSKVRSPSLLASRTSQKDSLNEESSDEEEEMLEKRSSYVSNTKPTRRKSSIYEPDSDHGVENEDDSDSDQALKSRTSFQNKLGDFNFNSMDRQADLQKTNNSNHSVSRRADLELSTNSLNSSAKARNHRFTHQFEFNTAGILNSTAIQDPEKRTKNNLQTNFGREDVSVEILSGNESDIVEISSGEISDSASIEPVSTPIKVRKPKKASKQQTLYPFIVKNQPESPEELKEASIQSLESSSKLDVTPSEYSIQKNVVTSLESELNKMGNMLRTINISALPDGGALLKQRYDQARNNLEEQRVILTQMAITKEDVEVPKNVFANLAWDDLQAGANAVQPKTFGKRAMNTYNVQKAITLDRLQQLHGAIETCPKEEDFAEDPRGLKVELMSHQKRALAWLMFREKEKPSGGILADDMGLGKTLTMLSLIVKCKSEEQSDSDEENEYVGKNMKYKGGSLIVCPASLINQWSGEIDRRLKRGLLSYMLFHGPKRETKIKKIAEYDVVITTYSIVNNEADKESALFKIKWRRIILDEAHQIRNYKSQTSEACCRLSAQSRWALTGTPMHNKELDMYALLKYLRCSPFDDLQVWKRWVGDKSTGGLERLHTVISSLMLRRTKVELMEKGSLLMMPEKKWELINVSLDKDELRVYHKVLIFSQTLFAQFLHQRAEKNQAFVDQKYTDLPGKDPNGEYAKALKILRMNKVKTVSQHEILVLLLRLRQICCHPSLITAMLQEGREDLGDDDEKLEEMNLLEQLSKMNLEDDADVDEHKSDGYLDGIREEKITLKEASRGHLNPSDPVFASDRPSSKVKALLKLLEERVLDTEDKAIIVSQWSSYLNLISVHLKRFGIEFSQLDGKVPVNKRIDIIDRFNNPKHKMKVLLLSLTAGGVGLNLVGGNHLFLLDLHWNPQLENQAQDRIYRVGQTKPVFIYKLMALDTIEERIKALQERKLSMAEGVLTGTKQVVQSKLTMEDLRMIFGM